MSQTVLNVRGGSSTKPRGTSLLETYEACLPNFDRLDEEQHLKFVKAIRLISDQYRISEIRFERETLVEIQPIIDRLRQLYNQYLLKNRIVASAIFIAMAHIESYYIDDPDAKLVHDLTGLHIHSPIQWLERNENCPAPEDSDPPNCSAPGGFARNF
jgi:hypothetical protein